MFFFCFLLFYIQHYLCCHFNKICVCVLFTYRAQSTFLREGPEGGRQVNKTDERIWVFRTEWMETLKYPSNTMSSRLAYFCFSFFSIYKFMFTLFVTMYYCMVNTDFITAINNNRYNQSIRQGLSGLTDYILRLTHKVQWNTRKLCYRKDDRAMRPIYGCREHLRDSLTTCSSLSECRLSPQT